MTGPQVFAFAPKGGRIECSAFSTPFKALAVALVTAAMIWAFKMWIDGVLIFTLQSSGWLIAALCMMAYTEWHILRGKTTLDNTALQQSWVWSKRTELRDLAYAKLIRVQGLDWLIAPRLYTKTFSGKLAVFYAAAPAMLSEFQRLEQELKAVRNGT